MTSSWIGTKTAAAPWPDQHFIHCKAQTQSLRIKLKTTNDTLPILFPHFQLEQKDMASAQALRAAFTKVRQEGSTGTRLVTRALGSLEHKTLGPPENPMGSLWNFTWGPNYPPPPPPPNWRICMPHNRCWLIQGPISMAKWKTVVSQVLIHTLVLSHPYAIPMSLGRWTIRLKFVLELWDTGWISILHKTSYPKILISLESHEIIVDLLWNLAGILAVLLLPNCLPNCEVTWAFQ